jgi:hypothetical protein
MKQIARIARELTLAEIWDAGSLKQEGTPEFRDAFL